MATVYLGSAEIIRAGNAAGPQDQRGFQHRGELCLQSTPPEAALVVNRRWAPGTSILPVIAAGRAEEPALSAVASTCDHGHRQHPRADGASNELEVENLQICEGPEVDIHHCLKMLRRLANEEHGQVRAPRRQDGVDQGGTATKRVEEGGGISRGDVDLCERQADL